MPRSAVVYSQWKASIDADILADGSPARFNERTLSRPFHKCHMLYFHYVYHR